MNHWENYKIKGNPNARGDSIVKGLHYRFTVLTPYLIRLEYSSLEGNFENRATQTVIHREFPKTEFRKYEKDGVLTLITEGLHLTYDKRSFSKSGLSIQLKGNYSAYNSIWYYGQKARNLKGTARTLDQADGAIDLEDGLLSMDGFAVMDDSKSMVLTDDGWVSPRDSGITDIYFFGYGRDYKRCLKDFYHLCGFVPLIPRYALGNWWSRFYPYTTNTYQELMERFENEGVPFSVSVLDMGWHISDEDMDPKYGSGWTGYTWNRKLFKEPAVFLEWLHKHGLHITLNVHPADGVRAHEEMYIEMAKELGVDYANEVKIPFDVSDKIFLKAYFDYLHHPNEDIGVDFWWVDWQQDGGTKVEGLDPLWMLNHYHYLDNKRSGNIPLTFSRYAGFGSHRYPIGFSGDTYATWESLQFQPYFTATASNSGYGWWSHDIGGHMFGKKSEEMAVRWLQFGVFSPIMRLHSSDNPFYEKEPWNYNIRIQKIMRQFLRFRHQMIPYLYTMNYRYHKEGEALIQPMYYNHSEDKEAYEVPNQYYFGSGLIVCPITEPENQELKLGSFLAWLPSGIYYDIFNGMIYRGGRKIKLYRALETIPVLAEAGAIIPLTGEASIGNSTENPLDLDILVFAGADGSFTLYEDNNRAEGDENRETAFTEFNFIWGSISELTVRVNSTSRGVIPEHRNYIVYFYGLQSIVGMVVDQNGKRAKYTSEYDEDRNIVSVVIHNVGIQDEIHIVISSSGSIAENDYLTQCFQILKQAEIDYQVKDRAYQIIQKGISKSDIMGELITQNLEQDLLGALFEVLIA